jgi:hypothetical protein
MHPFSFAHPNGVPYENRKARLHALGCENHWVAKTRLMEKFFPNKPLPSSTILLGFVGRITAQKGVHLILDVAEHFLANPPGDIAVHFIVGGMINAGESYSVHCAERMRDLTKRYPLQLWADPDSFFVDGPLLNFGADFGLMPSAFEPGGIVQQEFLIAGTPVVAFKTGGLRDTITEYYNGIGNGFTFEAHMPSDFANAIGRAISLFRDNREGYETLRKNSASSVITSDMVARAWLGEFYRMHNRLYISAESVGENGEEQLIPCDEEEEPVVSSTVSPVEPEEDLGHFIEVEDVIDLIPPEDDYDDPDQPLIKSVRSIVNLMAAAEEDDQLASIRVTYKPRGSAWPESVMLSGSFDHWASRIPLHWDKAWRVFVVDLRLPKGQWLFKLVVDGQWTCVDDFPIEVDPDGFENNIVSID